MDKFFNFSYQRSPCLGYQLPLAQEGKGGQGRRIQDLKWPFNLRAARPLRSRSNARRGFQTAFRLNQVPFEQCSVNQRPEF
jgi:hypothetical protein